MSAAAESTPGPVDLAALLDGQWVLVPTTQTMHDGSELRTWGVQANGVWIGRAHPVGSNPMEQALAHRHAALFAASKRMAELLSQALCDWPQFDADEKVSGADLVDWFAQWRLCARRVLAQAGVP